MTIDDQIDEIYNYVLKEHPGLDDIQLIDWTAGFRAKISILKDSVSGIEPPHTDALSGLPGRNAAEDSIDALENTRLRVRRTYAVIFIDLDNLKETNDTYGHMAGDFLIANMGSAIKSAIRPMDFAFRWGGDEFLVVIDTPSEGTMLGDVVNRIREYAPEASYGTSLVKDGETIRDSIARADESMYREKKSKYS